jgi:hypothetical protein
MGEVAVVLRDQLAHGANEFPCGGDFADLVYDDIAPLIQSPLVGVAEGVRPSVHGACRVR